jgi:hypothetical protein
MYDLDDNFLKKTLWVLDVGTFDMIISTIVFWQTFLPIFSLVAT